MRSSGLEPVIVRRNLFSLKLDPRGLGAVIFNEFIEPGMLQGLPRSDSLPGIVNEDLPKQIQERLGERRGGRNNFFQLPHRTDEFSGLARSVRLRVLQLAILEKASSGISIMLLRHAMDFTDKRAVNGIAGHSLE